MLLAVMSVVTATLVAGTAACMVLTDWVLPA
jgi:hypothetical protein